MLISEMRVISPATLSEALQLLAEHREQARPLAGATDAMVRVKEGHWRVPVWVNVRHLPELAEVREDGEMIEVGAALPYGRMLRSDVLRRKAPLLLQAVREIGSVQIRATGTLGGNLGTASPAGDSLPPLYALEAQVRLISSGGERWVGIEEFFLGPGKTVRRADELIASVRFRAQLPDELSLWQKLGLRGAQAISVVSLAMRVQGRVTLARFAFGAVGPTVLRARKCEAMLMNAPSQDGATLRGIGQMAWKEVLPITDIRATAEYRQQMAAALLTRGLLRLLGGGDGK